MATCQFKTNTFNWRAVIDFVAVVVVVVNSWLLITTNCVLCGNGNRDDDYDAIESRLVVSYTATLLDSIRLDANVTAQESERETLCGRDVRATCKFGCQTGNIR